MTVSAWTEDRIGRLKTLWLEGRSAAQIARELDHDITRSAVLGKVHRLGLSAGRAHSRGAARSRLSPPRERRARPAVAVQTFAGPASTPTSTPGHGQATLMSVRRCECRWPYGDPKDHDFSLCGRPVARGAFCDPHAAVAYRPVRQTPESLETLAKMD
ncbi:MAG: GcrA family cell cycle regulator [Brevundimonas sp.]